MQYHAGSSRPNWKRGENSCTYYVLNQGLDQRLCAVKQKAPDSNRSKNTCGLYERVVDQPTRLSTCAILSDHHQAAEVFNICLQPPARPPPPAGKPPPLAPYSCHCSQASVVRPDFRMHSVSVRLYWCQHQTENSAASRITAVVCVVCKQ